MTFVVDWIHVQTLESVDDLISKDEEIIPSMIRMAFHDCVGHSCDGCINFDDGHNKGITLTVKKVDDLWKPYDKTISRADFWQLASHVALIRSGLKRKCHDKKHCSFFDLQFWWGRKDCHTAPHSYHGDYTGDGHGDYSEIKKVLHGNFGLDDTEIVALMGIHSVGGGHRDSSGFDYNWQQDYLVFDNQYYKNLVSLPRTFVDVGKTSHDGKTDPHDKYQEFVWFPHHQDKHHDPLLMLNVDVSLWKDVEGKKDHHHKWTGELTCKNHHHDKKHIDYWKWDTLHDCKDAETAKEVYEYANDIDAWFHAFTGAWWKMVSHGYEHHHLNAVGFPHEKCGYCIPKGATCVEGFEKSGQCCPGSHCVHHKCV